MKCEKCGKKLRKNEKFCTVCGYYNDEKDDLSPDEWDDGDYDLLSEEQNNENGQEINTVENSEEKKTISYSFEKERDLEAYIGEDYKMIKKSPFNIYAFLLNWMYVLYRKLYITGIIGLSIALLIALFYTRFILYYLIGSMVILGFIFNPYYIFIIKQRIKRLEIKYEGSDAYTFTEICEEKGGVNGTIALIIYFIFLVIIFFCLVRVNYNKDHNTKFWKENSENKANCNYYVKLAYSNIQNENYGTVKEATCKISTAGTREYNIYMKTENNNETIYVYYETENQRLKYSNSTDKIKVLEEKQKNKTITREEIEELTNLNDIESNYNIIVKNSKSEDELIKQKKNTKEKVNYVFDKEEVIR